MGFAEQLVTGAKTQSVKVFLVIISLLRDRVRLSSSLPSQWKDYQIDTALLSCSQFSVLLILTKPERKAQKNWLCLERKTNEVQ